MLATVRGKYESSAVKLLEDVPYRNRVEVLVTFLDQEAWVSVISADQQRTLRRVVKESRLGLSATDVLVLWLAQRGRTTGEIAERMKREPKTIRNRLSRVYKALGVTTRGAAVAKAVEVGLLDPLKCITGDEK
ncbi:MAG: LuxR family transcriptional regulator [Anaerolineales bacterium]|nr:MAG: LuxR family transcriptional regulator [Anaerolineales bacterium]